MELLLNLIWLALTVGALAAFAQGRLGPGPAAEVPYRKSLLALACVLVLLFPVISASDDLHPAQAVVEDASKKLQLAVAPLQALQTRAPSMLPAILVLYLMSTALVGRPFRPTGVNPRALDGAIIPVAGRSPPFGWN